MNRRASRPVIKPSASPSTPARAGGWLGGTVLFGFMACQSPENPATGPVAAEPVSLRPEPAAPALETQSRETLVVRPDITPDSAVTHTFPPVKGQPCQGNFLETLNCTVDGKMWGCYMGAWNDGGWYDRRCVPGTTQIVMECYMGYNGIDKSGRKAHRAPRRARALA